MTQTQALRQTGPDLRRRRRIATRGRRGGDVGDDQMQELRDIGLGLRRRWWIPTVLAVVGAGAGVAAATNVPLVYRSEATVLVGPTDGSVTHSSTVRTSEDLATFYADMARREIVLRPVNEQLGLRREWYELRNRVSAVVPAQNPRLVTVTVMGASQQTTNATADAIVNELTRLSPARPGGNEQKFVNEQAHKLQATINDAQKRVKALKARASLLVDPAPRLQMDREIAQREALIVEWQKNYVELITADPTSDAGGLRVIDKAAPVTDLGRSGVAKQAGVGAAVGWILGLVIAWLLHGRASRREHEKAGGHLSPGELPGALPPAPAGPAGRSAAMGVNPGPPGSRPPDGKPRGAETPPSRPGPAVDRPVDRGVDPAPSGAAVDRGKRPRGTPWSGSRSRRSSEERR